MIIRTHESPAFLSTQYAVRIQVKQDYKPAWSDLHQRYYVPGHRWIKSRKAWSTSCLVHSFPCYTVEEA